MLEVGVDVLRLFTMMMTQVQLEGEKYVTGSFIISMIEQLRHLSLSCPDSSSAWGWEVCDGELDSYDWEIEGGIEIGV